MGKFILRPCAYGFNFSLVADDGQILLRSQNYKTEEGVRRGIESVAKNAAAGNIEDQTVEGYERVQCPKFEIYIDADGKPRIRLLAINGQKIAAGVKGFADVDATKEAIAACRAAVVDYKIEEAAAE